MRSTTIRSAIVVLCVLAGADSTPAQIFLDGTQPNDIVNWPLIEASNCRGCHGDYVAGLTYEPFDTWAGSMMANSARDPLFWAAVDIANQDIPGAGEFCIRCHSPRAWLSGRSTASDGSAMLGYPDEPDNDFEGIDCHFCHRMYEGPNGTPFLQNGQYWVDDGTPSQEPPRRGPYQQTFAPHPTQGSDYHASSEFCATCHDLRNPLRELLDENGVTTGELYPEQMTYTEWTQSAFEAEGVECQDCHMPAAETEPAFACNSFNPPRPSVESGEDVPVYRHDLVGANTFVPQILKGEYGAGLGRETAYDYTIQRATEALQQNSATLAMTPPTIAVEGDSMVVSLRVTNLTGHKLPTGYPEGRRMWLRVEATDALGTPFWQSGAYEDSSATLIPDPQLRTYETKHGVHGVGPGFNLVLNDRIFSDTRIPPRGFRPNILTPVIGRSYAVQPDSSLAHWDDVDYTIPVPAGVLGPVRVRATLRYQTAARDYVEFLRDENVSGPDPHDRDYPSAPSRGEKIHALWSQYGKSAPVDMVSDEAAIAVQAPPPNVSALVATPGHNRVGLAWSLPASAAGVRVFRLPDPHYPEYGSTGGSTFDPAWPARAIDAAAAGWVEIFDGLASSAIDSGFGDADRAVVHYAAFAYDAQGVHATATAEARTSAVNYRLGDLAEIGQPGVYDGSIDGARDLPAFSQAYATVEGEPGFDPEVDFAPTSDGSSFGLPLPDDAVDFLDLLIFSLQYGSSDPVGRVIAREGPTLARDDVAVGLRLEFDPAQNRLYVVAEAGTRGLHALRLGGDLTSVVDFEIGPALRASGHPIFATRGRAGASIDVALLGPEAAVEGGHVLTLELAPDTDASSFFDGERWTLVDRRGAAVEFTLAGDGAPTTTSRVRALSLSPAQPNPFNPRTRVELETSRSGLVEVVVYDVAGRRVRSLLQGTVAAGRHSLVWDGTDDRGRAVASGAFLIRARGFGEVQTQRLVLVR